MLTLFSTIIASGAVAFGGPTEFHPPVRLKADGVPVHVEDPRWAVMFRKAEVLKGTDGEPLIIPVRSKPGKGEDWINNICTRPFAVDWDGDGHLDLVVGTFPGKLYLFKGQGSGEFLPKPEEMKAGDRPLVVEGHHGDPFVTDWDSDGDLDILSGSSEGGVQWAENLAGRGKPPRLSPVQKLIGHGARVDYGSILRDADIKGPLTDTRIWVDDVNSDGKLDSLVGDMAPLTSPAAGLSEAEFKKRFDEWTKERHATSEKMQTAKDDNERTMETPRGPVRAKPGRMHRSLLKKPRELRLTIRYVLRSQ